jgi:hypothetical protein
MKLLMDKEIRIRAFRAPDDIETCYKFIAGHQRMLSIYDIENVSTNTSDWIYNPSIFVVVVETMDKQKLYGGTRVQVADGINPLPIEEATWNMDSRISDVVAQYAQKGTGELSGLWNSIEVAGYGIGSLFPIRASIVIAEQIGLESLFFLCSPFTVRFNKWVGSRIITEVGNGGTFYYPKLDLIATAVVLEDAITLENAHPREKQNIMFMRQNLSYTRIEKSPFKNISIKVHYDLKLDNVNKLEFKVMNVHT